MERSRPQVRHRARALLRVLLALGMVSIGVLHFLRPEPFVRIVPPQLPAPWLLVYASGLAEIALGLLVLPRRTRRLAAFGLVALYVAVFPANLYMALAEVQLDPAAPLPLWMLWARLPLQVVFIAWALWVRHVEPAVEPAAGARDG